MIIKLTQKQAEQLGLVTCECGHPNNNHFGNKKGACAHCKCLKYRQILRYGLKLVKKIAA